MDFAYETQLKQARDRLEVADRAVKDAATALEVVAETLIHQDAPRDVEGWHADIVDAGAHARSTCRQVSDVASQAAEVGKAAGAVGKVGGKIEFAARRLFAELMSRADKEEQARREPPTQQTAAEGIGDPCRAPRDIPGIDGDLLDEIAAELDDGAALTLQVLGYRLGLRQEGAFDAKALLDTIINAMAEDIFDSIDLTKAERWVFAAGVKQAAKELGEGAPEGEEPRATAPPGAQTIVEEEAPALRAPKDVPDIDKNVLDGYGNPGTFHALGTTIGKLDYVNGDKAEDLFQKARIVLDDGVGDFDGDHGLTEAEAEALREGIAESVAEAEATSTATAPLLEQVTDNLLQLFLDRAAEQGRKDAPASRKLHSNALAGVLKLPDDMAAEAPKLYAAYLEAYQGAGGVQGAALEEAPPVKRGRGRPRKAVTA